MSAIVVLEMIIAGTLFWGFTPAIFFCYFPRKSIS